MSLLRRLGPVVLVLVACGDSGSPGEGSSGGAATEPATSLATTFATSSPTTGEPTTSTPTTGASEATDTGSTTDAPGTDAGTDGTTAGTTAEPGTTDGTTAGTTAGTTTGPGTESSDTGTGGAVCGDGVVEGDEGCDDGPDNGPNASCHEDCQPDVCGDGQVGPGEACDDANDDPVDGCNNQCALNECGDGMFTPDELCDDSNDDEDDGCTSFCTLPACGDGLVQPLSNDESCDDGVENDDAAACTSDCKLAQCGDGLLWTGEEACDDGNAVELDACSNTCVVASCMDAVKNAGETGVDCGGPDCPACPFVLMLGGNASKQVGGSFDGKSWVTVDIAAPAVDRSALTITSDGIGVGVFRFTKINDPKDQQLQYVRFDQGWTAPVQIGLNTTRAAPSISATGKGAHLVFHGLNFQFYYAGFDGVAWIPGSEMIGSFGPGPGSVATLAGAAAFVFHDGAQNNNLSSRLRTPPWQPQQLIDATGSFADAPKVVALSAGAELLTVYVRDSDDQLRFATRKAGVWSAAANLVGASAPDSPALAGLPGGKAVVGFRGFDNRIYTATYDAANNTWTAVTAVAVNPISARPPALAPGIGAAEVELVYLDTVSKTPRHVRRIAGVWAAPLVVSMTGLESVALASRP